MATTELHASPGPPVPPSEAQGAQIPLSTFNLPAFPTSASNLKALTLTSTIPLPAYQTILSQPFTIPPLPPGIESLTLELFSLGYPPQFLSALASRLPNLKSVVLYSQLFSGTSAESQDDAVEFFRKLSGLRAVHFLDCFAQEGFFRRVAKWLRWNDGEGEGELAARRGLMFLEVNYTMRAEEGEEMMRKIQARELVEMVGPGLISCSFNVSGAESAEEGAGEAGKEGIMAFDETLAAGVVKAFTDDESAPKGLRALNLTLYTLTVQDLRKVLKTQRHVSVLNVTVAFEAGDGFKKQLLAALEECKNLEQVEIVSSPTPELFIEMQSGSDVFANALPSARELETQSSTLEKLSSFKANILRSTAFGALHWVKQDGKWIGGATQP